jgi:putative phosphoribosyl transferase
MLFADRVDAGRRLVPLLEAYRGRQDVIVLGIPRGGVVVANEIARALGLPLDVFVSRKLGVPGQEELGFGAISSGGVLVLNEDVLAQVPLSAATIERVVAREQQELERRERLYRGGQPMIPVQGKTVLLVDDGIATGGSLRAAVRALRQAGAAAVVAVAPVGPASARERIPEADDVVLAEAPEDFFAIGQFYGDFPQVSDEQVAAILAEARARQETSRRM